MAQKDRGQIIFDAICEDVIHHLNPNDDECWYCGGDGETHDCFDGCCIDAEIGCPDCRRPCQECRIFNGQRAKQVRKEVIELGDIDVAIAWLKDIGRWHDGITREQVAAELKTASAALTDTTGGER